MFSSGRLYFSAIGLIRFGLFRSWINVGISLYVLFLANSSKTELFIWLEIILGEFLLLSSGSEINKENLPSYIGKKIFWIIVTKTDNVKKDKDVINNIYFLEIKILIKFLKSISSFLMNEEL